MEEISGEDKRVKERDMGELPATARKVTSTGLRCKNAKAACRKKSDPGARKKARDYCQCQRQDKERETQWNEAQQINVRHPQSSGGGADKRARSLTF